MAIINYKFQLDSSMSCIIDFHIGDHFIYAEMPAYKDGVQILYEAKSFGESSTTVLSPERPIITFCDFELWENGQEVGECRVEKDIWENNAIII